MTPKQWEERKKKVIQPIKYFWQTMQIVQVMNPFTKVMENKEVPYKGTYCKLIET